MSIGTHLTGAFTGAVRDTLANHTAPVHPRRRPAPAGTATADPLASAWRLLAAATTTAG